MAMPVDTSTKAEEKTTFRQNDEDARLIHLAKDLKAASGSDLPLSCFIEQARLKSARSPDGLERTSYRAAKRAASAASDCFKAWAMPD